MPETEALARQRRNLAHLGDIALEVEVELGRKDFPLEEAQRFRTGDVIQLDCLTGEHADIRVNGALFGEGEICVRKDAMSVRITRIYTRSDVPSSG